MLTRYSPHKIVSILKAWSHQHLQQRHFTNPLISMENKSTQIFYVKFNFHKLWFANLCHWPISSQQDHRSWPAWDHYILFGNLCLWLTCFSACEAAPPLQKYPSGVSPPHWRSCRNNCLSKTIPELPLCSLQTSKHRPGQVHIHFI